MRRQLIPCLWARHSECTSTKVRGSRADHEVATSGGSQSLSAADWCDWSAEIGHVQRCQSMERLERQQEIGTRLQKNRNTYISWSPNNRNNNNINSQISTALFGRDFRGAGDRSDQWKWAYRYEHRHQSHSWELFEGDSSRQKRCTRHHHVFHCTNLVNLIVQETVIFCTLSTNSSAVTNNRDQHSERKRRAILMMRKLTACCTSVVEQTSPFSSGPLSVWFISHLLSVLRLQPWTCCQPVSWYVPFSAQDLSFPNLFLLSSPLCHGMITW